MKKVGAIYQKAKEFRDLEKVLKSPMLGCFGGGSSETRTLKTI